MRGEVNIGSRPMTIYRPRAKECGLLDLYKSMLLCFLASLALGLEPQMQMPEGTGGTHRKHLVRGPVTHHAGATTLERTNSGSMSWLHMGRSFPN